MTPPYQTDLLKVARTQRVLLWHVLALLVVTATQCIAPVNAPAWVASLKLAVYAVVVMLTIAQAVRLSVSLGASRSMTTFGALLMFVPVIGLILVVGLNAQATTLLRKQGLRVGVMGVPAEELAKLRPGVCRACGYDLAGLTAERCPECGCSID